MRTIVILLLLIGLQSISSAQSEFLEKLKSIGSGSKIPQEFAEEFLGASKNSYRDYDTYRLQYIGTKCGDSILFIYTHGHPVGSLSYLTVMKIDGSKEYNSYVIDEQSDHDGAIAVYKSTSYERIGKQIIELIHLTESVIDKSKFEPDTHWLLDGESFWDLETETTLKYEYLKIDGCSIKRLSTKENIDSNREFPIASERLLTDLDLKKFSSQQLRLMRNEIFAAYGYRFKSPDLSNHFKDKEWYSPEYDDVTDQLTDIEKLNVQLILKNEKSN
jgi:hypothetical protein